MLLTDPLFATSAERLDLLRGRQQQCDGGPLPGCGLDLQRASDELGALSHREQADALLVARRLDDIEAHPVVGDVEDPTLAGALPGHTHCARLGMLVHVLERLL